MKVWGLAALGVLTAGAAAFGQERAGQDGGLWLPYGASTITPDVDLLYRVIFYVTALTFVLVEGALIVFCVLYRRQPGVKPHYSHGNRTAEIIWTAIPGAMLVGLALWQMPAWAKAKQDFPAVNVVDTDKGPDATNKPPVTMQVLAQQFQFNFRYRPEDNTFDFPKAVNLEEPGEALALEETVGGGTFFVPVNRKILMTMTSTDVIHSLFLPHMRVKQDAVPGMYVRVWFQPNRFRVVDLTTHQWEWVNDDTDFEQKYGKHRVAFTNINESNGKVIFTSKRVDIAFNGGVELDVSTNDTARKPTHAIGTFPVACAELCGNGHQNMASVMWVGTERMYLTWLSRANESAYDITGIWKRRWIDRRPAW